MKPWIQYPTPRERFGRESCSAATETTKLPYGENCHPRIEAPPETRELGKRALGGHSRLSTWGGIVQFLTVTWVFIHSCPPAYVMGGHDVQHLGGLYPYQVIIILQQGLQALQAACGGQGNF